MNEWIDCAPGWQIEVVFSVVLPACYWSLFLLGSNSTTFGVRLCDGTRVDVRAEFGGKTWHIDVRFACPATRSRMDTRHTATTPGAAARLAYGDKVRAYRGIQHALVGQLVTFVVQTGGRLHADSLGSLNELVGGAVREQMTRGSLESVGDV